MKTLFISLLLVFALNTIVQGLDVSSYHPEPFRDVEEKVSDKALPSAASILGSGKIFEKYLKYNDRGEFINGKFMVIYKGNYFVCIADYSQTGCELVNSSPTIDKRRKTN